MPRPERLRMFARWIRLCACGAFTSTMAFAGSIVSSTYFQSLPAGASPAALALNRNGNILIAGTMAGSGAASAAQAFAAEVAPDGQTLIYLKLLGAGSAVAAATDANGNAYLAGITASQTFPVTPGGWNIPLSSGNSGVFVVKLDPSGNVIYSSVFGGAWTALAPAIAVNAAGEAFVTGYFFGSGFPSIGGSQETIYAGGNAFLVRLNAAGSAPIYSIVGPGGSSIAVDEQNNAYVAGTTATGAVPITSQAFQTAATGAGCPVGLQDIGIGALFPQCAHQYVCKVSGAGDRLYFCTYISGSAQEVNPAIAVDALHNIYLTGVTWATDYPTTPGALQTQNRVQPPPALGSPFFILQEWVDVPATGYYTALSGDGSRLLYSTYLGGSLPDSPTGIAANGVADVYIAARVRSSDFPGLPAAPQRCLPGMLHTTTVAVHLDASGIQSMVFEGPSTESLLALSPNEGEWVLSGGNWLTQIPAAGPPAEDAVACVTDGFDFAPAAPIVAGELLSIFGEEIGPPLPVSAAAGSTATSLGGVSATIGGAPATLLWVGAGQVNLQVPVTLAAGVTTLSLTSPGGVVTERTLPVAAANPSLLTDYQAGYATCDGATVLGQRYYSNGDAFTGRAIYALVLNADGTVNSCQNPASTASNVTVLVNAAGTVAPAVTDAEGNTVTGVRPVGGLPGVWYVDIAPSVVFYQGGQGVPPYTELYLTVDGVPVREQGVAVWLSQ